MVHQIDLEMLDLGVENRVLEDAVDVAADGDGETRLGDVTEGTPKGMMNDVIDAQDGETSNRHCGALNYVNATVNRKKKKYNIISAMKLIAHRSRMNVMRTL